MALAVSVGTVTRGIPAAPSGSGEDFTASRTPSVATAISFSRHVG
jgi:hypothetical protein